MDLKEVRGAFMAMSMSVSYSTSGSLQGTVV